MTRQRFISLEGCFNFRDLGGYRTHDGRALHWRRLYRSDSLHWMSHNDVTKAKEELEIAIVMDLRSVEEIKEFGIGPLVSPMVSYYHLPLLDTVRSVYRRILLPTPSAQDDLYIRILKQAGVQVAMALTILAQPVAWPIVFYCTAGKDRTGILAAVLLAILGVEEEDIIQDYTLTNQRVSDIVDRLKCMPIYGTFFRNIPPESMRARQEWIEQLLLKVQSEYGSMRAYARAQGVSEEVFCGLERNFLMD